MGYRLKIVDKGDQNDMSNYVSTWKNGSDVDMKLKFGASVRNFQMQ